MEEVKDFEQVRMLHEQYLNTVVKQCFLEMEAIAKSISEILHFCRLLCTFFLKIDEESLEQEEFMVQFHRIKDNFEKLSVKVFRQLSNFKDFGNNMPFLPQLLLRFDYNNYFTALKEKQEQEINR